LGGIGVPKLEKTMATQIRDIPHYLSGGITLPAARSGFTFKGYVANLTFDMDTNEVVRGTLSIQPTGNTTFQQGT
jgi:hypothetical protein